MIVANSKLKQLALEFDFLRAKLFTLRRINLLLKLTRRQLHELFLINGERRGTSDELLYRSYIYTLFYANWFSVSMIANQERLDFGFSYVDTKLILRAVIERCITQKFILSDPQRLALLFFHWGTIEKKRFHEARDRAQQSGLTLAVDMDFEGVFDEWSAEREAEYQESVVEWESLVQPKQQARNAKSWSGSSMAEMAKLTGLEDLYKITYRETSWYSHGLAMVPDLFIRSTKAGIEYSSSVTTLQRIECYLQAEKLFLLSFSCADDALSWNVASKIAKIEHDDVWPFAWILELIRLYAV